MQQITVPTGQLVASGFTVCLSPRCNLLTGRVFDDPEFADGTDIVTSPLRLIVRAETADLAYTQTAVYELSAVHPDLITAFLEAD